MNILLYAAQDTESGGRLQRAVETLESLESLTCCSQLPELLQHLRTPEPLPETVVVQAASWQELNRIEPFRFRLEQVFFVLVLPDDRSETVARGHRLRPRFIAYQDSDFAEVGAVLGRLEARICRTFEGFSSIVSERESAPPPAPDQEKTQS